MFRLSLSHLEIVIFYTLFFILITSATDDLEEVKQKRHYSGGVEGLFPFPRNGRSDPEWNNIGFMDSFEEYEEYPHYEPKRSGLIPFPRVGRSGHADKHITKGEAQELMLKSLSPGSGLWFGPRLGRVQKRSNHNNQDVYTPRLGRESGEKFDENFDYIFALPADKKKLP